LEKTNDKAKHWPRKREKGKAHNAAQTSQRTALKLNTRRIYTSERERERERETDSERERERERESDKAHARALAVKKEARPDHGATLTSQRTVRKLKTREECFLSEAALIWVQHRH